MNELQRGVDTIGGLLSELTAGQDWQVIDVGGGSGTRSVPLAVQGCRVTVIDPSIDALATLHRRATDAGVSDRVRGIQGDTDGLRSAVKDGCADLVLCHHVLETIDDPAAAVAAMARALAPGGLLSLLVAGRHAAVLALAIAGRFAEAERAATDPDGRFGAADPLLHRFDVVSATALLTGAGLQVQDVRGVGVVSGLVPGAVLQSQPDGPGALTGLEAAVAGIPPLRDIAADLHVLARRPGDPFVAPSGPR